VSVNSYTVKFTKVVFLVLRASKYAENSSRLKLFAVPGTGTKTLSMPHKSLVLITECGIVIRNKFSAEEHMSRNQKTRNQFCTEVSVDT